MTDDLDRSATTLAGRISDSKVNGIGTGGGISVSRIFLSGSGTIAKTPGPGAIIGATAAKNGLVGELDRRIDRRFCRRPDEAHLRVGIGRRLETVCHHPVGSIAVGIPGFNLCLVGSIEGQGPIRNREIIGC